MDNRKTNKFNDILEQTLSYWPNKISVNERVIFENGGAKYPSLVDIHDLIENKLSAKGDDFLWVMDFVVFSALHKSAETQDVVHPLELNKNYLKKAFESHLMQTEELSKLRDLYDK